MPYKNSKVRMYYSKYLKRETPQPFAEFRVFMITTNILPFPEEVFDDILDRLEWLFSTRIAREKNALYFITGREINVLIDNDEAKEILKKTGIEAKFGEVYRQAYFWLRRGKERAYNERDIREMPTPLITFNLWKKGTEEFRVGDIY